MMTLKLDQDNVVTNIKSDMLLGLSHNCPKGIE